MPDSTGGCAKLDPVRSYLVDTQRSTVLVSARSTMGPILFEGRQVEGRIDAAVRDEVVLEHPAPSATLTIYMQSLRSGNELYDAELRRRIDVARHPTCRAELTEVNGLGEGRYAVSGRVTVQDISRRLSGSVEVGVPSPERLTVVGEQVLDVRDFKMPTPQLLLVRIYPEVRIQLFLDARLADDSSEETP